MRWQDKLAELADRVRERDDFVVVHHYDADGCTSGAIMYKALERSGKKVKRRWIKQLYRETVSEIRGLGKNYVFVDFGSGQLGYLAEEFGDNLFVFDHHQKTSVQHPNHFSPFDYGINGGNEVSASGIAFLFAQMLDGDNIDLVPLAVVGAVGDVQDYGGSLSGLNGEIVERGVSSGFVKAERDLRLYGRVSRPLVQFLAYSTSPFLPELTANEENCRKFLNETGIEARSGESWRTYSELSGEEKKRLATALILHLSGCGTPEKKIGELFGEVYLFPHEDGRSPCSEAREMSTLCNACGRNGRADLAVEVCLGDRGEKYAEALALMTEHRRQLRNGIEFATRSGIREEENFYLLDAGTSIRESIVGIVAGMLYGSGAVGNDKPVIAVAENEDGSLKISGRATRDLVGRGVNLGLAFREICSGLGNGNEGGGHGIAAGAKLLRQGDRAAFLKQLNGKLREQLGKAKYT